jgi:ribosomal protein S18 acetylase RimI-like enzyme
VFANSNSIRVRSHNRSYNGYFVDLFVRASNSVAISMYTQFGYTKYRQVIGYYSGEEDAWGNESIAATL